MRHSPDGTVDQTAALAARTAQRGAGAVRAAVVGDALISPQITVRLLRRLAPEPAPRERARAAQAPGGVGALTAREREIAGRVGDGATNAEIGAALFISPGTVKNHLATIQRKVGARNRVGVAAWAWEHARPPVR
ncbi:response regulator transcription factor [Streptomyces sp. Qhu_M48]|uniref:response regulator transcription factor n=1 Tax=Streptomyces sp. Qhu_M48 TaxID=3435889 RepID=UPI003F4F51F8